VRIKFGSRFPFYLTDIDETREKIFLQELTKQSGISDVFLPDVKNGDETNSITLKLRVGATIAAKETRATFNGSGGEQPYTPQQRILDFKHADNWY
jgi:hypothetical protein